MTALILQARLDSSRLPGKALLPLGGEAMIYRVMRRLSTIPAESRILACPADAEALFSPLARRAGFILKIGPKDDVLARYALIVREIAADAVIRATGDNPFVLVDAAAAIVAEGFARNADYAAYTDLPYGAGVEFIKGEALLRADHEATLPYEREHVCPYIYKRPERFVTHRPKAPADWRRAAADGRAFRLTVDTEDDYRRAAILFDMMKTLETEQGAGAGAAGLTLSGAAPDDRSLDAPLLAAIDRYRERYGN